MPKVILLSQLPLPYGEIGSWTTMYKNYLESKHQINYIVCEQPKYEFSNVKYSYVAKDFFTKVIKTTTKNPYFGYLKALEAIIQSDEKHIIQIVDNFGIIKPLHNFLVSKKLRQNCYLQFFYHGFPPFYENFDGRWFFDTIDEMVVLTNDSYHAHKNYYTILPTRFSVLHNGIDLKKFYKLNPTDKAIVKEKLGVNGKTIFVWCSQDRPKKGLHLVLDAWKKVHAKNPNTILWVIGCKPKQALAGVQYLGRIPNDEVATYFQASDCYLFPTLCHEGFGLSLIEALHCGNFCIASALGGVPEVLRYGKLGKLIDTPHFVSSWEEAMIDYITNLPKNAVVGSEVYSSDTWNSGMNDLIMKAKDTFG